MNENALRAEMGIPLLAHPKHTYSKIGDSDSEYSSDPKDELDDLIQYSKEVKSNSTKNSKCDQDSPPKFGHIFNTAWTDSALEGDTRS